MLGANDNRHTHTVSNSDDYDGDDGRGILHVASTPESCVPENTQIEIIKHILKILRFSSLCACGDGGVNCGEQGCRLGIFML